MTRREPIPIPVAISLPDFFSVSAMDELGRVNVVLLVALLSANLVTRGSLLLVVPLPTMPDFELSSFDCTSVALRTPRREVD